uniref:UPF0380 proteins YafZ and homologs n=1 Tax=Klebsiella pneumoniae TaxID=573 RepID=A0A8B0SUD1_KLEPN|nr:UPF0380 proteins YafZ and homologs [Klebsiella pneumoniae]
MKIKKDDIWTTYQRVQENLIKGGLLGRTEKKGKEQQPGQ